MNANMKTDKLPPQALDLEQAVLGAILIEKDAIERAEPILPLKEYFYADNHQKIYSVCLKLYREDKPIDILSVVQELRNGGLLNESLNPVLISRISGSIGSSANIEHHARIIAEKYIQRRLLTLSHNIAEMATGGHDVFDTLDTALYELEKLNEIGNEASDVPFEKTAETEIDRIVQLQPSDKGVSGVDTGFQKLNEIIGGWQKSDSIIVAARPGMGKTAFALTMAKAAIDGGHVGIFSLEMSKEQLIGRIIASLTGISSEKMRNGYLDRNERAKIDAMKDYLWSKFHVCDFGGMTLHQVKSQARIWKQRFNIELLITDYLQLMSASNNEKKGNNREQEISVISRGIKSLAKKLMIPCITLSQLSRANEARADKRPLLSDLRESGSIEQDADIVVFIHRPEYYGDKTMFIDDKEVSSQGLAEIIVAKHRNGKLGTIISHYHGETMTFKQFNDLPF